MGRDVRVAVDEAERLIDALLTLARSDHGLTHHERVDLATLAEDALDPLESSALRLHTALDPATTAGEPVLLQRLVANLVDNAGRYNRAGGDVWITTSTTGGRATLVVANTGPVVSDQEVALFMKPFQRAQGRTAGTGFGLGLAIVTSVASAHRGTVTARPRSGGGLEVTVELPSDVEPVTDAGHGGSRSAPSGSGAGHRWGSAEAAAASPSGGSPSIDSVVRRRV
jgi:signal transduction histidine kinase